MEALSRTEEGQMEMGRALIEGQKELAKIISFFVLSPALPALLVLLNAVEFLFNWDRYEISYWGEILHRRHPSGYSTGACPACRRET